MADEDEKTPVPNAYTAQDFPPGWCVETRPDKPQGRAPHEFVNGRCVRCGEAELVEPSPGV